MIASHYIDNEITGFGEWDSVVTSGGSSILQTADAAFPERGNIGLRVATTSGNTAFVNKNDIADLEPGETLYIGSWWNLQATPSTITYCHGIRGSNAKFAIAVYSNGQIAMYYRQDSSTATSDPITPPNNWIYLVQAIKRATTNTSSDGWSRFYLDGNIAVEATGLDNFDTLNETLRLEAGCYLVGRSDFILDFDEIKISNLYPEPFVPSPEDEFISATRTVVLVPETPNGRGFADYCFEKLGTPFANRLFLQNASANESLNDYSEFQNEVENDITNYFTLNPSVSNNCMCFLYGPDLPGKFNESGSSYSSVSRLMNFGSTFTSSGSDNPLFNPANIERLTKTSLGGKYLATRIDAVTIEGAKAILDKGITISGLTALPDTDKFYSDQAAYKTSLSCQKLRLSTSDLEILENDAFVWGDILLSIFSTAGSRAVFTSEFNNSSSSLRSGLSACFTALSAGYAASLGNSSLSNTFDVESFFEMLHIGGTFAEAVMVAVSKLDYTAVPAGDPLMTVNFPKKGLNIYHGPGGPEAIDWSKPVAYLKESDDQTDLNLELLPTQRHCLGVRAVSSDGVEDKNTHVFAYTETDVSLDLLPQPLFQPYDVTADLLNAGTLLIGFSHKQLLGYADPEGFEILTDNGTEQLDLENPIASVLKKSEYQSDFEKQITPPTLPAKFAVRAYKNTYRGPLSRIVEVKPLSVPIAPEML